MDEDAIERMIAAIGEGLTLGHAAAVAQCWDVPALVLGDDGAHAVASLSEVESFFATSIPFYRERGVVATRGELLRAEPISENIAAIDVRWPGFDAAGVEISSETSHYLVSHGADGAYRVRVAMSRLTA